MAPPTDITFIVKTVIGSAFLILGWFLRESYKDFKNALAKLNKLYEDHLRSNEVEFKDVRSEMHGLDNRIKEVETRQNDCDNCPGK
jgi:hypothetical protein